MKSSSSKVSPDEVEELLSDGDKTQSDCNKQQQITIETSINVERLAKNTHDREINQSGCEKKEHRILIEPNNNNNNNNDSCYDNNKNKMTDVLEASTSTNSKCCIVNVLPLNKKTGSVSSIVDESSSKHNFDTISLCEPCCRVCQCDASEEDLISPCSCSGSVKWIHESCLIQWMKSSLKESCELCTKKIKITKRRKPFTKVCCCFVFCRHLFMKLIQIKCKPADIRTTIVNLFGLSQPVLEVETTLHERCNDV